MAAIPWERIVLLQAIFTDTGNRCSIGLHYFADSVISGTDNADFVTAWLGANGTLITDCQSQECKFEMVSSHGVKPETVAPVANYNSGLVGAIAQEALPMNIGAVFQLLQTEVSGRHNGRFTLPGIPETATTDGLITTAFATTELEALAVGLETAVTVGGKTWRLCNLQRMAAGAPIMPQGWQVTNVRPTRNMGTQRRRTTELREYHP